MIGTVIIKILIIFQKMIDYSNLIVLHEAVHRLVHLKDSEKIKALLNVFKANQKAKRKT